MSNPTLKAGAVVVLAHLIGYLPNAYDFGMVLAVSDYDNEGGQAPFISVITIPDPESPHLSKANWQLGVRRITGVAHITHPEVVSGARSICWTNVVPGVTLSDEAFKAGEQGTKLAMSDFKSLPEVDAESSVESTAPAKVA